MGIGAAVSVVGGAMQLSAANKASDAAQEAAALQSQYLAQSQAALENYYGQAVDAYQQQLPYLGEQLDMTKAFQEMMMSISDEYGEFANNMWADWENTFGDIRSNLVEYYQNLDPLKYSTNMKAEIGQEIAKGVEQFDQAAAQSGIYTSGMALQNKKEAAFNQAQAFAQADIAAPDIVANMQNQFYGTYGEPARQAALTAQGNAILNKGQAAYMGLQPMMSAYQSYGNYYSGLSDIYQNQGTALSNLYNNISSQYGQSAVGYGSAAGTNFGTGLNNITTGLTSLFS